MEKTNLLSEMNLNLPLLAGAYFILLIAFAVLSLLRRTRHRDEWALHVYNQVFKQLDWDERNLIKDEFTFEFVYLLLQRVKIMPVVVKDPCNVPPPKVERGSFPENLEHLEAEYECVRRDLVQIDSKIGKLHREISKLAHYVCIEPSLDPLYLIWIKVSHGVHGSKADVFVHSESPPSSQKDAIALQRIFERKGWNARLIKTKSQPDPKELVSED